LKFHLLVACSNPREEGELGSHVFALTENTKDHLHHGLHHVCNKQAREIFIDWGSLASANFIKHACLYDEDIFFLICRGSAMLNVFGC
jgi:hypothetical protein